MIPYGRQSLDDSDVEAVVAALRSDWLTTGPRVAQFEADVASVVVRVPDAEALPERIPGTTAAGNLSLRKATRTQWKSRFV